MWAARRAQFGQIVDQLEKMWAQIKEDKDEQGMASCSCFLYIFTPPPPLLPAY